MLKFRLNRVTTTRETFRFRNYGIDFGCGRMFLQPFGFWSLGGGAIPVMEWQQGKCREFYRYQSVVTLYNPYLKLLLLFCDDYPLRPKTRYNLVTKMNNKKPDVTDDLVQTKWRALFSANFLFITHHNTLNEWHKLLP